jgi:hypothetical protein
LSCTVVRAVACARTVSATRSAAGTRSHTANSVVDAGNWHPGARAVERRRRDVHRSGLLDEKAKSASAREAHVDDPEVGRITHPGREGYPHT